jgi:hypothetical protein
MPQPFNNRARVGGSGFTIFTFGGQPIAFAQQLAETSPTPVFDGAVDLVDVFIRQAEYSGTLNVVKYIRPPVIGGRKGQPYAEQYHGCVITNITDGEQVEVGTMEIIKQVTVAYRYKTRNNKRSKAFAYRDRPLT